MNKNRIIPFQLYDEVKKANIFKIKSIYILFGILMMSTNINAQNYKPIANVAGLIDGKINIESLLKSKKIDIWNNQGLKIKAFKMYNLKEKTLFSKSGSAKFTKEMIEEFKKMPPLIIFHDIIAVNKEKDTIYLNPIAVEVTKEKSETNLLPLIIEYPALYKKPIRGKHGKGLLLVQTGVHINNKDYKIINQQIHHLWNNKYNYNLNSNGPRFSGDMHRFIRCCVLYKNYVIFYKIKAKKTNGFIYNMPIVLFELM